ncbi:MAG: hypothetical protein WDO15_01165 [Bacteroidota bacterium]
MTRITKTIVELSEMIKESNLIVEVECLKAFTEEIVVKGITNTPPFIKKGFEFKITNVLKNSGKITVPEIIRVPIENWRRSFNEYKSEHGDAPTKSYEVKEYETELTSMKKAEILFLHQFQNSFELEVKGAFESKGAMEKVTMLIESE